MYGYEVYYIGVDDMYGMLIMLCVEKEGLILKQLIDCVWIEYKCDFDSFGVLFDNFYLIDLDENCVLSEKIYFVLQEVGLIVECEIEQVYDLVKEMFLLDCFIKGECLKCYVKDQYGDNCEVCGLIYLLIELLNLYLVVFGVMLVCKILKYYFFCLFDLCCELFLCEWVSGFVQFEVINKMCEWFGDVGEVKFVDWDILCDVLYFGFEILGVFGKYFYVWFDVLVGYYVSFKNLCECNGIDFDVWICFGLKVEQYYFIGKDILYFYMLFWFVMFEFLGYCMLINVFVYGFLIVDGVKMLKLCGMFIIVQSYIDIGLNLEWLCYYFVVKLNVMMEDIDLNFDDFQVCVNSDFVGKYVNIVSCVVGFLIKCFDGCVQDSVMNYLFVVKLCDVILQIVVSYEVCEYGCVLCYMMEFVDEVNVYVDGVKLWDFVKDLVNVVVLYEICSVSFEVFCLLLFVLKLVMLCVVVVVEVFFGIVLFVWVDVVKLLLLVQLIKVYQYLMMCVDVKQIEVLFVVNCDLLQVDVVGVVVGGVNVVKDVKSNVKVNVKLVVVNGVDDVLILIDDFVKIDLCIVKIVVCQVVEGLDKLLQFMFDVGEEKICNVFLGIKFVYQFEQFVGKLIVMVVNFVLCKMKFGLFEGMVFVVLVIDEKVELGFYIFELYSGVKFGMCVK